MRRKRDYQKVKPARVGTPSPLNGGRWRDRPVQTIGTDTGGCDILGIVTGHK